ncbi:MAG TPA: class E sortase [Acidimicrobiales bacterium]|nr:class E sortase [Acidimicrobiales bacterium]
MTKPHTGRSAPHSTPTRLLSILIAWLLVSGLGGLYLQHTDTSTPVSDDPTTLLAAAKGGVDGEFKQLTVPTTAPPTTVAPKPRARTAPMAATPRAHAQLEPIVEIGTIEIPKIGLVHKIMHGITLRNIDEGPSHWPGTAFPGEVGNAVFAGHRVTHSHPFRHIDQLVAGDRVFFTVQGVRSEYSVTSSEVVSPKAVHIANQTPTPTATLFACHPPGSAKQRYVVHLDLVGNS